VFYSRYSYHICDSLFYEQSHILVFYQLIESTTLFYLCTYLISSPITRLQEDEKEQARRLAAVDKERKDLEKEELKRKRESDREAKEKAKQLELISKENKKLVLKCTKEKRKSESIDRNKVRAVYRKDFSSELKRVRTDANASVLQYFDEEETLQEQAEHSRYYANRVSTEHGAVEGKGNFSLLDSYILALPSCNRVFLEKGILEVSCSSGSGPGSSSSVSVDAGVGENVQREDMKVCTVGESTAAAAVGGGTEQTKGESDQLKTVDWDNVFQAANCLSVFNNHLQLQMPLMLDSFVERFARISVAGEACVANAINTTQIPVVDPESVMDTGEMIVKEELNGILTSTSDLDSTMCDVTSGDNGCMMIHDSTEISLSHPTETAVTEENGHCADMVSPEVNGVHEMKQGEEGEGEGGGDSGGLKVMEEGEEEEKGEGGGEGEGVMDTDADHAPEDLECDSEMLQQDEQDKEVEGEAEMEVEAKQGIFDLPALLDAVADADRIHLCVVNALTADLNTLMDLGAYCSLMQI
jgi:hypothetical protein